MAASGSTTKKKKPGKAQLEKERKLAELARRKKQQRDRTAVVLLVCGIVLTALALVSGESVWNAAHEAFFGAFGVLAYAAGPFAFWFAVAYAFGKNPPRPVLIKGVLLFFAIAGALLIFGGHELSYSFAQDVVVLFNDGKLLSGGGAASVLFGWTLLAGCGQTAAKVLISALIFLLVMLITGKTVVDLVNGVRRPLDAIKERAALDAELEAARAQQEPAPPEAGQAPARPREPGLLAGLFRGRPNTKFDIDVPIDRTETDPDKGYEAAAPPAETAAPDPLPEPAPAPLPIDFSPEGKRKAAEIARETAASRPAETRSIDIPLGPDFEPEPDKGFDDTQQIIVNTRTAPAGPAAEIVSDLLRQQETFDALFTDFGGSSRPQTAAQSGEPANDSAQPVRQDAPESDFARRMENLFRETAANNKEEIPHLFDTPDAPARGAAPEDAAQTRQALARQEYQFPPLSLLTRQEADNPAAADAELRANAAALVKTLESFGVRTRMLDVSRGPSVTRYELQPDTGVRLNKIVNLADDLALNLAAEVRIEAPIPGKSAVGIEVPNKVVGTVNLRSVIESDTFRSSKAPLTFAVGKDISGAVRCGDISKMPHLLIAGSTGMGKSVCINSLLISLVYKSSPADLQLILIDPKMVEFTCYSGLPHLYIPVVTDPKKAAGALGSAVGEMMRRYTLFSRFGVRNVEEYNAMIDRQAAAGEPPETDEGESLEKKPRMVIVIDELADLMMTSPNEVEDAICRIAQMGRAAGVHLVVATQRPSVDVITGTIKNNIPTRIAFKVSSQIDSRTIIDAAGAEKLIGRGDMLFLPVGQLKPIRIQGCFVSDTEVNAVVGFLKQHAVAQYNEQFMQQVEALAAEVGQKGKGGAPAPDSGDDTMLEAAIEVVVEAGQASTSLLQRRLKLGYGRAARIMDEMFEMGVIGPSEGSKPREVRMTRQQWQERLMNRDGD